MIAVIAPEAPRPIELKNLLDHAISELTLDHWLGVAVRRYIAG
jgi:hypothetical protein